MSDILKNLASTKPKETPQEITFSLGDFDKTQLAKLTDPPASAPLQSFTMDDFQREPEPEQILVDNVKQPLERIPRVTVERMIKTAKMNEEFVFFTQAGRGEAYVQSCRVLISRIRDKLRASGKKYQEFKLNTVSIKRVGTIDRIVLSRVSPGPGSRNSKLYADLENLLTMGE